MSDSVRAYVLTELDLPSDWRQIEEQRLPEVIDRETVIVKHTRIERLPDAPIGHLDNEVILAVFVPNRDLARAEDRLDNAIVELLAAIDAHPKIGWREAEKVVTPGQQYPGWELTLRVITEKTTPTPTPTPDPESEA